jgi:hypothetical protein
MNREAIRNYFAQLERDLISDASRLANELQAQFPNMSRTHALKEADRIVRKYGVGVSLAAQPPSQH